MYNIHDMTTISEVLQPLDIQASYENPYTVTLDSERIKTLSQRLVNERVAFIDKSSNPDIAKDGNEYSVYSLEGCDEFSDISRAIEGSVMLSEWGKDPEETRVESSKIENNSLFFLVVDTTNPDDPIPAASLSIADCLRGGSDTIAKFLEQFGTTDTLPMELTVTQDDMARGLWDVMAVMVSREYRLKGASAWAYHALYKASQDLGVQRWVANIVDSEFDALTGLGIPFEQIPDTNKYTRERQGKKPLNFGFYNINVDDIRVSVTQQIADLENRTEHQDIWQIYARMARIALDGALNKY